MFCFVAPVEAEREERLCPRPDFASPRVSMWAVGVKSTLRPTRVQLVRLRFLLVHRSTTNGATSTSALAKPVTREDTWTRPTQFTLSVKKKKKGDREGRGGEPC